MTFLDKAIYEDYIETIFVQAKLKIVVKAFGLLSRLLSFSSLHRLALVKALKLRTLPKINYLRLIDCLNQIL